MLKANITTEVSPIVGSEKQSEELVSYLLREFEESPGKIWESNIFGTSLYGIWSTRGFITSCTVCRRMPASSSRKRWSALSMKAAAA